MGPGWETGLKKNQQNPVGRRWTTGPRNGRERPLEPEMLREHEDSTGVAAMASRSHMQIEIMEVQKSEISKS